MILFITEFSGLICYFGLLCSSYSSHTYLFFCLLNHMHFHTQVLLHMLFPLVFNCPTFHQKFILQGLDQTFQVFHNSPFFHPKYRSQFIICSIFPGNSHILIIIQVTLGVVIYVPVYPSLCLSSSNCSQPPIL